MKTEIKAVLKAVAYYSTILIVAFLFVVALNFIESYTDTPIISWLIIAVLFLLIVYLEKDKFK